MSINDDVFDVVDKLEGTTEEESFERIMKWANNNEANLEMLLKRYNILIDAFKLIKNKDEVTKEFDALDEKLKNK